jgi:hypothetical protein
MVMKRLLGRMHASRQGGRVRDVKIHQRTGISGTILISCSCRVEEPFITTAGDGFKARCGAVGPRCTNAGRSRMRQSARLVHEAG